MEITAAMVGELRERTGAGLMDCKRVLVESGGDMESAVVALRKKGIAGAAKKADREASEGTVEAYIHTGGRIGVLLQLNCETDFVAKTEQFHVLAKDLCLHVAASNPSYISKEQVPEEIVRGEMEIGESQCAGKSDSARESIVRGRLAKYYASTCLLEQPFVKNPAISVGDLIRENIGKLGENVRVVNFARFQTGGR
ncbi:MAG: translation elongation factor Ts [Puniceicoccales bacterium]|jgi:elongation factor Ts|nr:translation elongation factor Ts [Puniceicoccales bacterium]